MGSWLGIKMLERFLKKFHEKWLLALSGIWALFVLLEYSRKIKNPIWLALSAFKTGSTHPWQPGLAFGIWSESLVAFFASFLLVLSFWRAGRWMGKLIGLVSGNILIKTPMEFGLGVVGIGQVWLALGFLNLWVRLLLVSLLVLLALWALVDLLKDRRKIIQRLHADIPPPSGFFCRCLAVLAVLFILFSFGHGLAPEIWTDSLVYHLGFLANWMARHGIADMPTNSFITFPFAGELYFLNGVILKSGEVSKLLHAWVFLMIILFSGGWALEIAGQEAAWLAMGLVSTFPMLVINVWTTQVEGLLAFYTLLTLYGSLRLGESEMAESSIRWIVPSAIFGGMILSIKYTGLIILLALGLGFVWQGMVSGWRKIPFFKLVSIAIPLVLAVLGPWMIRNICWTGNPVYPCLNEWFGQRLVSQFHAKEMVEFSKDYPYALGTWWKVPWNLTMPPVSFFNFLGPCFLATLPLLIAARPANLSLKILLKILAAYSLIGFFLIQIPRFHIPLFVGLCLVLACGWQPLHQGLGGKALALFGVMSALLSLPFLCGISSHYFSCGGIWGGQETRTEYLGRMISADNFKWASWIRANTEADSKILLTSDARGYYMERPFCSNMAFDPYPFHEFVRQYGNPGGIAKRLKQWGVDYVVAPRNGPVESESWLPPEEKLTPKEWKILEEFIQTDLEPVFLTDDEVVYKVRDGSTPHGTNKIPESDEI